MRISRPPRHLHTAILVCTVVLLVGACGSPEQDTTQAVFGATNTATPVAASLCHASQLALGMKYLGGGAGHAWEDWSITNTSDTPCSVDGGLPQLAFNNAAGTTVTTYKTTPLGSVSTTPIVIQPAGKVWFFTDITRGNCSYGTSISGGPFTNVVTLPGTQIEIGWRPPTVNSTTLGNVCPTYYTGESGLQTIEPTLQSEERATPAP
jgi:hypothetical protein